MSTAILPIIQSKLILYGYPIFMILGDIGNLFIVIIFSKYRQNTCAIYLIALAILNSIYLTFYSFNGIFPFYYGDETIRAFVLCKLRSYLVNIFGELGNTMIVLACIDRFLLTSSRVTYRAFSTPKRAKWLILFSIIFWSLFLSFTPVIITIVNGQCGNFGIYGTIYSAYSIIFIGLIPPMILCIFGYLAYRNMRQAHNRIQPVLNNQININNSMRRRDRELWVMVISEVLVYVVTASFYPITVIEMMISQNIISNKSVEYLQIESFLSFIGLFFVFINRASPFYIYLIVSKPFRRNFIELITSNARLRTRSSLSRRNTILTHNNLFIYSVSKNETSLNDVFSDIPIFQSRTSKHDFFVESRGFT
jgi:hypothetical protein